MRISCCALMRRYCTFLTLSIPHSHPFLFLTFIQPSCLQLTDAGRIENKKKENPPPLSPSFQSPVGDGVRISEHYNEASVSPGSEGETVWVEVEDFQSAGDRKEPAGILWTCVCERISFVCVCVCVLCKGWPSR